MNINYQDSLSEDASELKDFSYGYEKEETIVMEPVVDEKNKTEENNDKNE